MAWGTQPRKLPPPEGLGSSLVRELPDPTPARHPLPPPRPCSSASSQGRRHKREPRLLEPPLPWGRGPQDSHLVAIEEEKL